MQRCTLYFVFNKGQVFEESWPLTDNGSDTVEKRCKRIAQARQTILARNVRIVKISAKGFSERVDMPGYGGEWADPQDSWKVMNDHCNTNVRMRGLPKEVVRLRGGWPEVSPDGARLFKSFTEVLRACGCHVKQNKQYELITDLKPVVHTLLLAIKKRHAPKWKLIELMGPKRAEAVWSDIQREKKEEEERLKRQRQVQGTSQECPPPSADDSNPRV